jgi:hypothetical protein
MRFQFTSLEAACVEVRRTIPTPSEKAVELAKDEIFISSIIKRIESCPNSRLEDLFVTFSLEEKCCLGNCLRTGDHAALLFNMKVIRLVALGPEEQAKASIWNSWWDGYPLPTNEPSIRSIFSNSIDPNYHESWIRAIEETNPLTTIRALAAINGKSSSYNLVWKGVRAREGFLGFEYNNYPKATEIFWKEAQYFLGDEPSHSERYRRFFGNLLLSVCRNHSEKLKDLDPILRKLSVISINKVDRSHRLLQGFPEDALKILAGFVLERVLVKIFSGQRLTFWRQYSTQYRDFEISGKSDVLLLQFETVFVAEFSPIGALHIYDNRHWTDFVTLLRKGAKPELFKKDSICKGRYSHYWGWEDDFAYSVLPKYGVKRE